MMKRQTPEVKQAERALVYQFVLEKIKPDPHSRVAMGDVHKAYVKWRGKTYLTADGFGRIFPPHFKRKTVAWKGSTARVIMGVKLAK